MAIYLQPLKKYADFSGRASRKEYWSFYLAQTLVMIAFGFLTALGFAVSKGAGFTPLIFACLLFGVFILALIVPGLAVTVRRLHDRDMSGWFILIGLIPYIGGIALVVLLCLAGTEGDNQYGPDPKALGE